MSARLIARLDIKGPNLIKGVQMEGLRVMGDPYDFARRYYEAGVDELLYIDIVASLYGRSKLTEVVRRTAQDVFVPMTVGGGIRSIEDVTELLRAGADKVAINTAAVARPDLIAEVANRFGSQCMVLSIEAKQQAPGTWEVYTETGREHSGLDVVEWARRGVALGAGEVLVTSIDREGTRKGFDTDLIKAIAAAVEVPVIASGGYGAAGDLAAALGAGADAVAVADALHYGRVTLDALRQQMQGA
ncbi:MAG: imidazole glycerol phosphate synthase cyclase subunit [Rhodobacteraceae bacterium]|nr:imidazole glycerol phosphate synthase cyclase subunit [Paracoccaceae bacterium]MCF8515947.1 imidazole glycerol phosphate synthase cyclase subunit [Paracoccaceae bacterium]MCF8520284.1 imidazole glycerol phosphate synthase cyclase subunit [Paracoccaceae bacterium]